MLIKNGFIPDFDKKKLIKKNIVIKNNIISDVLPVQYKISDTQFNEIINAEGFIVSPGFIDSHSHSDLICLNTGINNPKFRQGITSEITGNCGISVTPVKKNGAAGLCGLFQSIWGANEIEWNWTSTNSYLKKVKNYSINNIYPLIGYSTLRYYLTGIDSKPYDSKLLSKMEKLIETELEHSVGISIGIGYAPNIFAQPDEYELIAKLLKKHDKILTAHIRDEGGRVIESINEIIEYVKKYNPKINISHIKAYGKKKLE